MNATKDVYNSNHTDFELFSISYIAFNLPHNFLLPFIIII